MYAALLEYKAGIMSSLEQGRRGSWALDSGWARGGGLQEQVLPLSLH